MTTSSDGRGLGVLDRLALGSGAAWGVLMMAGNSMTEDGAPTEDTPASAQAYFALLRTGSHGVGIGLELLGMCLLVVFLARVVALLRAAEGPGAWLPGLALAGGLVTVAVKVASAAPVVVGIAVTDLPAEQAQLLLRLNDAAFLVTAMTSGLMVLGLAGSALVARVLPRWLAVLGLPLGALAVLGSLAPRDLDGTPGVAGFLLGMLWVVATSAVLAVRRTPKAQQASTEALLARA